MKRFSISLLIILVLLSMSGCGTPRNVATVRNNEVVKEFFLNPEVSAEYKYYYNGPDDEPIAYLALKKEYRLQSNFWFALMLNAAAQKRMDALVRSDSFRSGSAYIGKEILSPDAVQIGLVLTSYHWITAWFDEADDHVIVVAPPQLSRNQPIPLTLGRSRNKSGK